MNISPICFWAAICFSFSSTAVQAEIIELGAITYEASLTYSRGKADCLEEIFDNAASGVGNITIDTETKEVGGAGGYKADNLVYRDGIIAFNYTETSSSESEEGVEPVTTWSEVISITFNSCRLGRELVQKEKFFKTIGATGSKKSCNANYTVTGRLATNNQCKEGDQEEESIVGAMAHYTTINRDNIVAVDKDKSKNFTIVVNKAVAVGVRR